jgi:putative acetyltransferase
VISNFSRFRDSLEFALRRFIVEESMITIRAEAIQDQSGVRAIVSAAFKRPDEARLVDKLRATDAFIPELSLVADEGVEIVGHILFSAIRIRTSVVAVPGLALAPLAVRPDRQKVGIGSMLVRQGLEKGRRLGHRVVVVVGHPAYYPRFGFVPARERGLEAPFPVSDAAFMVCELMPDALDGVRGQIEYPPPFAEV